MDSNSESPCKRLIKFILQKLSCPAALLGSARVPIEEGSSRKPTTRPNGCTDSEIVVDFRHTEETRDLILGPKKDRLVVSDDPTKLRYGLDRKGIQETEVHPARGKGPKKTVTMKGSEKEANQSGGDDDQATIVNNHDETIPKRSSQHWPLRSVMSNIDKKSDEFIESRKKAMGRNYSLDHEKS